MVVSAERALRDTNMAATRDGRGDVRDAMEYSLTEEEMKKINYLGKLERRKHRSRGLKQNKFSDRLSLEAQIAMQLALKDTQAMKRGHEDASDVTVTSSNRRRNSQNHVTFADERTPPPGPRPETQCSKASSSFSETFERRGSVRMSCDLTDAQYEPASGSRRSLDGTKVENALEMVEIVNHDDDDERLPFDDDAIEQIAQRNSVEKCLVWMEVLGKEGQLPKRPAATSKNTSTRPQRTPEKYANR